VAPGAVVPVTLDTGADGLARTLSGAVTEISRAVDADARTFLVKIALPEDAGLRSGMFGRARFGGRSRRALTVPTGALVAHGQMTSAFVVENHIARVRLVDVRGEEVLAGLSEGDVVVVSAPSSLRDGSRVKAGVR
jgi:multidrug efflux pump subunit AcrA (membrane-fusion protein)